MKVLLATLHSRYSHSSLALPSLAAAVENVAGIETEILELTLNEPHDQLLRRLMASQPDLIGFSTYIWNINQILRLAADIKQLLPHTLIFLGGPEASYGSFGLMEENPAIDCVVRGEGEVTFRECLEAISVKGSVGSSFLEQIPGLCLRINHDLVATPERTTAIDLDEFPSPFAAGLAALKKPLVYYETSRGCPFSCAFCISSLEKGVRSYSMERIKKDLLLLMANEVQTVKLVDRTFNFDAARANEIWQFIQENNRKSRFHFEIAADLLTESNLELLEQVPAETFRFEIGVQSGKLETLRRVNRKSDLTRLFGNVRKLLEATQVTTHLDLVAGLPHEDYNEFLRSLQSLLDLSPHHIQVEPLKVLKGSPMRKIAREEGYVFSASPPYKILNTPWLSFREICRIEEIGRLLDQLYNSGRFTATLRLLASFLPLSELFSRFAGRLLDEEETRSCLSRESLYELVWRLCRLEIDSGRGNELREALCFDYCSNDYPAGDLPGFFAGRGAPSGRNRRMEKAIQQLNLEKGSRIRIFTREFDRDFRAAGGTRGIVELNFIYLSAPGKGLRVVVLEKKELE